MASLSGQLGNVLPSSGALTSGATTFMLVVGIGLFSIFLGWVFFYITQFKVKVYVEERRGSNIVEWVTRGGVIKNAKSGVKEFRIWRGNWNPKDQLCSEVPGSHSFRLDKKGKPILRIYKDSEETFKLVKPTEPGEVGEGVSVLPPLSVADSPTPTDLNWYNWASQTLKGLAPRYRNDKGLLREHAGLISFGGVLFVFLVAMVFMLDSWGEQTGDVRAISDNMKEVALAQERTTKAVQGKQVLPSGFGDVQSNPENKGGGS